MQEIAATEAYTLAVDPAKNRIYWTVTGNGLTENPMFVQDWEKARGLVSRGFTVLTDVSRIPYRVEAWLAISAKLQCLLIHEGLAGTAEILPISAAKQLQRHRMHNILGNWRYAKEEIFTDRKIAEIWLDRLTVQRRPRASKGVLSVNQRD